MVWTSDGNMPQINKRLEEMKFLEIKKGNVGLTYVCAVRQV
jgi:hypothetical protein